MNKHKSLIFFQTFIIVPIWFTDTDKQHVKFIADKKRPSVKLPAQRHINIHLNEQSVIRIPWISSLICTVYIQTLMPPATLFLQLRPTSAPSLLTAHFPLHTHLGIRAGTRLSADWNLGSVSTRRSVSDSSLKPFPFRPVQDWATLWALRPAYKSIHPFLFKLSIPDDICYKETNLSVEQSRSVVKQWRSLSVCWIQPRPDYVEGQKTRHHWQKYLFLTSHWQTPT